MGKEIRIVFDGPPGPEAGRFIEVEDTEGRSISVGEWHERDDGLWELRIPTIDEVAAEVQRIDSGTEVGEIPSDEGLPPPVKPEFLS